MIDWKRDSVKKGDGVLVRETFSKTLKRLRTGNGLSQQQLSDALHVSRSTVASWETGLRFPGAEMILRIARCLSVDPSALLGAGEELTEKPFVILVDPDQSALPDLESFFPDAAVSGFSSAPEALDFARNNPVALALTETRLGAASGLALCRELLQIDPRTNVIILTNFPDFALEAWTTGACGYLLKPLSSEALRQQLTWLRHPVRGLV